MAESTSKKSLTAELDAARSQMTGYGRALRRDVNISARLKSSFADNPLVWFAAAAIIGLALSRLPARGGRKVVVKGPKIRNDGAEKAGKAAFLLGAVKIALDFAKPAIMAWVKERWLPRMSSKATR